MLSLNIMITTKILTHILQMTSSLREWCTLRLLSMILLRKYISLLQLLSNAYNHKLVRQPELEIEKSPMKSLKVWWNTLTLVSINFMLMCLEQITCRIKSLNNQSLRKLILIKILPRFIVLVLTQTPNI